MKVDSSKASLLIADSLNPNIYMEIFLNENPNLLIPKPSNTKDKNSKEWK